MPALCFGLVHVLYCVVAENKGEIAEAVARLGSRLGSQLTAAATTIDEQVIACIRRRPFASCLSSDMLF